MLFSGGTASNTKRPAYTRPGGDYLGGGLSPYGFSPEQVSQMPGFFGDVGAQQMFPIQDLFGPLQGLGQQAGDFGSMMRGMGTGAMQQAFGNAGMLGQSGMSRAGDMNQLLSMQPFLFGQGMNFGNVGMDRGFGSLGAGLGMAQQGGGALGQGMGFLGQGAGATGAALGQLNPAFSAANQSLKNVMDPTQTNPLFQNAYQNQVLPNLSASFASRGLAGGGEGIQAEIEASRDLSNQFAMRQFQEQQQGIGTLGQLGGIAGNIAGNYGQLGGAAGQIGQGYGSLGGAMGQIGAAQGNLGLQGAQFPGALLNQFIGGQNAGLQGLAGAQSLNLGPLQSLGLGGGVFQQGLDLPFQAAQGLYGLTRQPLEYLSNFVNSVPNISKSTPKAGILGLPIG